MRVCVCFVNVFDLESVLGLDFFDVVGFNGIVMEKVFLMLSLFFVLIWLFMFVMIVLIRFKLSLVLGVSLFFCEKGMKILCCKKLWFMFLLLFCIISFIICLDFVCLGEVFFCVRYK